jgi:hypothetical protein
MQWDTPCSCSKSPGQTPTFKEALHVDYPYLCQAVYQKIAACNGKGIYVVSDVTTFTGAE